MNYKHKLLIILILASEIGISNLGRHDIDWVTNYEDFAMNNGKYSIGRKNIIVYKKDGTISGKIEQPMPNFDGVIDKGNFALWGDSQLLSGVKHVDHPENFTFSKRHLRDDVELYDGYMGSSKETKYNKFSESIEGRYRLNVGEDYSLIRTNKIAFDAYVPDGITEDDWDRIQNGDLLARVGAGENDVAIDVGKEKGIGNSNFAGGLNRVENKWESGKDGIDKKIGLDIQEEAKTPLDSGTKPGDSGSPLFWWDNRRKKWLIASNNKGGNSLGYGKSSQLFSSPKAYQKWKDSLTDKEITENNVKFENGTLKVGREERKFEDETGHDKITDHLMDINHKIDEKMTKVKNQIFNKYNLEVDVTGNNNTGYARLEFKKNTTLKGNGTLQTAGFVVHKGATLNYELNFKKGNTVRKIGEGKLIIKSKGNNDGDLNLGGGETELQNTDGYAAKNIRLAQGAKLKINSSNQIKSNNVIFGHRGGTLNLNGNDLKFKDIYHMDKDANIVNENMDKKSTFTFTPKGGLSFLSWKLSTGRRVFL
ncbi:S6 family peptidase [Streptobacillus ratti]|uniref:S6 family peptidase n=2 Tax=Streptobacillus ratti TaxID=1720557 RepID=UPI000AF3D337|nr:S6 family peptidase [Streptobacillus ratti]